MPLSNSQISELLALRAAQADDHRRRAYLRAARAALMWPEEAAGVVADGRPLTDLFGIGERLGGRIEAWIEDPPDPAEPPPERADFLSLAEAKSILADDPGWYEMRGDLQMHTYLSDGAVGAAEMVATATELDYEYIAMTAHPKGRRIARGADEDAFARQGIELQPLNARIRDEGKPFHVLKGMEMNLDLNGDGDMDERVFAELDLVVGSFHSALRVAEDQTQRYLAALDNPRVDIIGHPRGRKFNQRLGLNADWDVVLDHAAERRKALEINSFPDRQDLNVAVLRLARPENVFSIGTDAHNQQEMLFFEMALASASSAGLRREQVVNFWPLERLLEWARAN